MSVGYDDLVEGERYELLLEIKDCERVTVEKRAFEMTIADQHGIEFPFVVWEKSRRGRRYSWREGHWYRLSGVSVSEWDSGKVLHGAQDLRIEHIGETPPTDTTQLLYMTDSHLGKSIHNYGGREWAVDPIAGFSSAIDLAVERGVDAVLHGGDIFHNDASGIGREERAAFDDEIKRLIAADIPFYYIYGNHERGAGRDVLEPYCDRGDVTHLSGAPIQFDDRTTLYGWDHEDEWSRKTVALDLRDGTVPVVMIHQPVDDFSVSNSPHVELAELTARLPRPAVLLVGHCHTRSKLKLSGRLLLSGGATARLGDSEDALSPSVELVTVSDEGASSERLVLEDDSRATRRMPR